MTLYSFKGHYPVEVIDNNKGWHEVPAKPEAPEGKEVAWLNGEWVVRDPKPADRPGYQWNWNHSDKTVATPLVASDTVAWSVFVPAIYAVVIVHVIVRLPDVLL